MGEGDAGKSEGDSDCSVKIGRLGLLVGLRVGRTNTSVGRDDSSTLVGVPVLVGRWVMTGNGVGFFDGAGLGNLVGTKVRSPPNLEGVVGALVLGKVEGLLEDGIRDGSFDEIMVG